MFREMRRKRQQLTETECIGILMKNTSGVLAIPGDSGYPCTVPLSYVYDSDSLYFHCAKRGHKFFERISAIFKYAIFVSLWRLSEKYRKIFFISLTQQKETCPFHLHINSQLSR